MGVVKVPIALQVNCGFARVAIVEFSRVPRGHSRSSLDKDERSRRFRDLFSRQASFTMPEAYYTCSTNNCSSFDHHCEYVLSCFSKKWNPGKQRQAYLAAFSTHFWSCLSLEDRREHSLANCYACATELQYCDLQKAFPGFPLYSPPSPALELPQGESVKEVTREVVRELNHSYKDVYGQSFSQSLLKYCGRSEGIEQRKTAAEKKKETRNLQRKFRDSTNQQYAATAALSYLSQNESMQQYQRKRMAQSFEQSSATKRVRSHVPSQNNRSCNAEAIVKEVQEWPEGKRMNWSEIARRHGMSSGNAGQIVKEIAKENGVDLSPFVVKHAKPKRSRSSKHKLPGGEISIPANPTPASIKADIKSMIACGKLTLGEPCAPYTITHVKVVQGNVIKTSSVVHGRRMPLVDLRKKLLMKHEKFMHLLSDDSIASLPASDVIATLESLHEPTADRDIEDLRDHLRTLQRSRSISFWHDHLSVLGRGYILVTVQVLYNLAVFMSEKQYHQATGMAAANLQQVVEEPELYIILLSSSSPSDQLAIIPDRIDDLYDLSGSIRSSKGIEVNDTVRFFVGDQPAQQFERLHR